MTTGLAVGALLLASCGGDDVPTTALEPGGGGATRTVTVDILQSRYLDPAVEVVRGSTIEFVNQDPFAHTVTAATAGSWSYDSGDLLQDDRVTITLDEPGTYRYFCTIHPTMRGEISVT